MKDVLGSMDMPLEFFTAIAPQSSADSVRSRECVEYQNSSFQQTHHCIWFLTRKTVVYIMDISTGWDKLNNTSAACANTRVNRVSKLKHHYMYWTL